MDRLAFKAKGTSCWMTKLQQLEGFKDLVLELFEHRAGILRPTQCHHGSCQHPTSMLGRLNAAMRFCVQHGFHLPYFLSVPLQKCEQRASDTYILVSRSELLPPIGDKMRAQEPLTYVQTRQRSL